jgi:hypothetical protein
MIHIRNEYNTRKNEIERYFQFLSQIENDEVKIHSPSKIENVDSQLRPTLRANVILLLYNLMESTVIQTIDYIHIHISTNDNLLYKDSITEIQKIWIEYNYGNFKGTDLGSEKIHTALQSIDNQRIDIFDPKAKSKTEYLTKVKGVDFSGKIDAKQIRKFAEKYGFHENTLDGVTLVKIKRQRNELAHGDKSFNEIGNANTLNDLEDMKNKTFNYLEEFLNNVEIYLNNKKYRR